jgi:hypothetical protein
MTPCHISLDFRSLEFKSVMIHPIHSDIFKVANMETLGTMTTIFSLAQSKFRLALQSNHSLMIAGFSRRGV